jgi:predicted DNA-binding transcriptional regulator AlpA
MVSRWQRGEITAAAAIKQLGISKATFYRRVSSQQQLPGK